MVGRPVIGIVLLLFLCLPANGAPPTLPTAEERGFWSFQPVADVAPPTVRAANWPAGAIDRFILARLEAESLAPTEPADKRSLIRRATFDLTGLPPTPDEVAAFLADGSPAAFANVVDRLLATPRYGERWGRHWLDVVRYADARDLIQLPEESDFREAWRYRDWVVEAFNRDLPYDEFITLQLAGDLLQPADPARIDPAALVATGFLAIADFVPGDVDKEQMIADYVNDEIDVVGRAMMGLTLACARCHDHKFDPLSIEDYYALAGIFFSTRLIPGPTPGNTPLVRAPLLSPVELQAVESRVAEDQRRMAEVSRQLQLLAEREYLTELQRRVEGETPRYVVAAWEYMHQPPGDRPALAGFAADRGLEQGSLERWLRYLGEHPQPALSFSVAAGDYAASERAARELGERLTEVGTRRRSGLADDPQAQALVESEVLGFRADDRRIVTNEASQVLFWPDLAGIADDALPAADVPAPVLTVATLGGHSRPVVRFHGQELLQSPRGVPPVGSLFVVFRCGEQTAGGERLIGWEDSSVGQHGLGLMPDSSGGVSAILRRNGSSGDLTAAGPPPSDFQLVGLTWGPAGVSLRRNGAAIASSPALNEVSSDPDIPALHIGGPGSGGAARFHGDLAELRVFGVQLDEASCGRVEEEIQRRWFGAPVPEPATADPTADLYDELLSSRGPFWTREEERADQLPEEARQRLAALREEAEALRTKPAAEIPRAVVVQEGGPPGTTFEGFQDSRVFFGGNPKDPGPIVPRGFPRVLAGNEQTPIREGSGRLELAEWLVSPNHPLTARVMVNRIWQHHFGHGLVRTSTNFGASGERPSHPRLLDYLAGRFVASGWSIKAMHRLIMLSSTYQQSSDTAEATRAADPENRLLGRMDRRRLEAEAIRDSLLAAAGRLDVTPGGPGFLDVAVPRRSLYLMSVRTGSKASEFSPLFDGPDCGAVVERRNETTVAPQALFLRNDPFVIDLATALADRIAREAPDGGDRERIERLYQIAFGRGPTPAEVEIGLGLVTDPSVDNAWAGYCQVILCTNEFIYVD